MKNLIAVLFVTIAVTITGCGSARLPNPTQGKIVSVERSLRIGEGEDPGVKFACTSADLDYNGRKITLRGVKEFGSYGGNSWVGDIRVEGNNLILELPSDADYNVSIGNQEHLLPKLRKE